MSPRRERIILIHGAWAGAWVWAPLVEALAVRGREAVAMDLPGDGFHRIAPGDVVLEDYFEALDAAIGAGPAVLVGHSGGGMLVSAGAARFGDRVSHGIWVAGMLLSDGESFDDVQRATSAGGADGGGADGGGQGVTPHIQPGTDGVTSTVPPEAAIRHFFHDFAPEDAAKAAVRLTPQPNVGHRIPKQTGPAFAALPKLYIHASDDRSVLPVAQRYMCAGQENLTVVEMATGHVPQVVDPEGLATHIDAWLGQ